MKKVLKWIWGVIITIGGIVLFFIKIRSPEIKAIKEEIKVNTAAEKEVISNIKNLETQKSDNKEEIKDLEKKLEDTKKVTSNMKKIYSENNVDEARKFLKNLI